VDIKHEGKVNIDMWTDLVWSEGLTDESGRLAHSCGAPAPEYHPQGPVPMHLCPDGEAPPRTLPPTLHPDLEANVKPKLTSREQARASAAARKVMEAKRKADKAARRAAAAE